MNANDIFQAAMRYVVMFSPIIFILAVISVADILIDFVVRLLQRGPDFGGLRRRSGR